MRNIKRINAEKRKQMLEELQEACRGSDQMDTALGLLIINGNEDALKADKARQKAGVKVQKYCQILKEAEEMFHVLLYKYDIAEGTPVVFSQHFKAEFYFDAEDFCVKCRIFDGTELMEEVAEKMCDAINSGTGTLYLFDVSQDLNCIRDMGALIRVAEFVVGEDRLSAKLHDRCAEALDDAYDIVMKQLCRKI